jgi:hypothetical protein
LLIGRNWIAVVLAPADNSCSISTPGVMTMNVRAILMSAVALSLVSLLQPAAASAQGTIRVFVGAAGQDSGFTEKGTDDSVLDLTKALRGKKRLMVISSPAEADVVVEVESRDSHHEVGGVYTYKDSKGKTQAYTSTKNERTVYATLRVGEYRHQLHGEGTTWTQASQRVASQVDKWVDQNLVRLIEKRQERGQ